VLGERVSARAAARHVAPYLVAQMVVLGSVLAFPALVHLGQPADAGAAATAAPAVSDEEIARRLDEMLRQTSRTVDEEVGAPPTR
jgi:hypothetical protein